MPPQRGVTNAKAVHNVRSTHKANKNGCAVISQRYGGVHDEKAVRITYCLSSVQMGMYLY